MNNTNTTKPTNTKHAMNIEMNRYEILVMISILENAPLASEEREEIIDGILSKLEEKKNNF